MYVKLVFDRGAKDTQWEKGGLFNKWGCENWTATCQRIKPDTHLTSHTKTNLKLIKGLNVKPEATKFLGENTGEKPLDIGLGNNFLHMTPKTQVTTKK